MTEQPTTQPPRPPVKKRSSSATRVLLVLTLMGMLLFVGSVGFIAWVVTAEDTGDISEDTFVSVTIKGVLQDAPPQPDLFGDPSKVRPNVTELAAAIRKAGADARVDGLYLQLEPVAGGWGSLQEIRTAIDAFRAQGKPCVAYAEMYDDASYYLASACDQIVLAPGGITMVNGMASSTTYYAETFEKIGVEPEFEHVGDFKSAIEPYERTEPSEPAAEAMNYLLDDIYRQLLEGIASGRGVSTEQARSMVDASPMSPANAVELGLIDVLAYPDAVAAHIHEVADEGWHEKLTEPVTEAQLKSAKERFTRIGEVVKDVRAANASKASQIAVIHAEGTILSGEAEGGLFGGSVLADRTFRKWIREVRKDESVKAIVLRVNSPGGSGLASDMMWRELKMAQEQGLPVVVSMADYAASGGYYIAAPADWIVAQPGTVTGSIGVFGGKFNLGGMWEKLGMKSHTYRRGELSTLFSANESFSEQGRATYRRFLSDFYETFLDRVGTGRSMERDVVHEVAQGRVWTGVQAKERNLVDQLGGLDVALAKAAELAELGEDDWGVKRWPRQKDLFEVLMEDFSEASAPTIQVGVDLVPMGMARDELEHLLLLETLVSQGPVTLLPGVPRFH